MCNPIEALINPANASTVESTVTLHKSAEISDQWNSKTAATFYCPENVTFTVTDADGTKGSVTCIDFKPAPPSAGPCVTSRPKCAGKSTFSTTCASTPPPAWTSPSVDATIDMQLRTFTSGNTLPFPVQILPYSATTQQQPPTDGASYTKMFNTGSAYVLNVPTGSQSLVRVAKSQGAVSIKSGPCDLDQFDLSAHISAVSSTSKTGFNANANLAITYSSQKVVRTCSESVLNTAEVFGLVGGGAALMITFNILVIGAINLVAKRAGESVFHSGSSDVQLKTRAQATNPVVGGANPGVDGQ